MSFPCAMPSRVLRRPPSWCWRRTAGFGLIFALCALTPSFNGAQAQVANAGSFTRPLRLGTVSMPNSGSATAQVAFLQALAALHSFEYDEAKRGFREAQQRDPAFTLAYWGEAMTFNHPVWNEQQADSARAVLARYGSTRDVRRRRARSPREGEWLEAVEVLYGEGSKARRDTLYLRAMEQLSAAWPDDVEAQLFTALAWLGLNQSVRSIPDYMKAGAIASRVLRAHPSHPGAAHYVIHAFDDPTHAPLGLDAARAYARIAPDAPHAQHMTTHIFLALGMWDETLAQNIAAVGDRPWQAGHYTMWWHYALTQLGREREAAALRDSTRRSGRDTDGVGAATLAQLTIDARHAVEFERWDDAVFGDQPTSIPAYRRAWLHAIQGFAAARRGDATVFAEQMTLFEQLSSVSDMPAAMQTEYAVYREMLLAMRELQAGALATAVPHARAAAAIADTMPVEFGPPLFTLPPHELLGALLMAQGDARESQRVWQRALEIGPGRSRALVGLIRAARATGDQSVADAALVQLERNWARSDSGEELLRALRGRPSARPF